MKGTFLYFPRKFQYMNVKFYGDIRTVCGIKYSTFSVCCNVLNFLLSTIKILIMQPLVSVLKACSKH